MSFKMNARLTKKLIELHLEGYHFDFHVLERGRVICVQHNSCFSAEMIAVRLVQQGYDEMEKCFKYIHTVETETGEKGLLLADFIFF